MTYDSRTIWHSPDFLQKQKRRVPVVPRTQHLAAFPFPTLAPFSRAGGREWRQQTRGEVGLAAPPAGSPRPHTLPTGSPQEGAAQSLHPRSRAWEVSLAGVNQETLPTFQGQARLFLFIQKETLGPPQLSKPTESFLFGHPHGGSF